MEAQRWFHVAAYAMACGLLLAFSRYWEMVKPPEAPRERPVWTMASEDQCAAITALVDHVAAQHPSNRQLILFSGLAGPPPPLERLYSSNADWILTSEGEALPRHRTRYFPCLFQTGRQSDRYWGPLEAHTMDWDWLAETLSDSQTGRPFECLHIGEPISIADGALITSRTLHACYDEDPAAYVDYTMQKIRNEWRVVSVVRSDITDAIFLGEFGAE